MIRWARSSQGTHREAGNRENHSKGIGGAHFAHRTSGGHAGPVGGRTVVGPGPLFGGSGSVFPLPGMAYGSNGWMPGPNVAAGPVPRRPDLTRNCRRSRRWNRIWIKARRSARRRCRIGKLRTRLGAYHHWADHHSHQHMRYQARAFSHRMLEFTLQRAARPIPMRRGNYQERC